jgi:hypothetical protein
MKRKKIYENLREESGTALIIALIMIVVLTLIGLSSTFTSIFETKLSGLKRESTNAYYVADAGAQVVFNNTNNFTNDANYVAIPDTTSLPQDLRGQPIDRKRSTPTLTFPGGGLNNPSPEVSLYHLRRQGGEGQQYQTDAYIVGATGRDQVAVAGTKKSEVTIRQKWILRTVSQSE